MNEHLSKMKQECNFMEITKDLVQYLESLGRLELSPEDEEKTQKALGDILGYFDQLSELDTEGVEPTYQVFEMENVWRDDEIKPMDADREELLDLTTEEKDHQIKVPKVL